MTIISLTDYTSEIKSVNLSKYLVACYLNSSWLGLMKQVSLYQMVLRRNLLSSNFLDKLYEISMTFYSVTLNRSRTESWCDLRNRILLCGLGSERDHERAKNFLNFLSLEVRMLQAESRNSLDLQQLYFVRDLLVKIYGEEMPQAINQYLVPTLNRMIGHLEMIG